MDMHKNIGAAIVRQDEAKSAICVEELHPASWHDIDPVQPTVSGLRNTAPADRRLKETHGSVGAMTGKNCMISPVTHRRGRLINTYSRRLLVLHVSNDDQEREQGSADNPNVNAHVGTSGRVPKRSPHNTNHVVLLAPHSGTLPTARGGNRHARRNKPPARSGLRSVPGLEPTNRRVIDVVA